MIAGHVDTYFKVVINVQFRSEVFFSFLIKHEGGADCPFWNRTLIKEREKEKEREKSKYYLYLPSKIMQFDFLLELFIFNLSIEIRPEVTEVSCPLWNERRKRKGTQGREREKRYHFGTSVWISRFALKFSNLIWNSTWPPHPFLWVHYKVSRHKSTAFSPPPAPPPLVTLS